MKKFYKLRIWISTILLQCIPFTCFADIGGDEINTSLQNLINLLCGEIARSVVVISIIGYGLFLLFRHQLDKSKLVYLVIGGGMSLGAQVVATRIWGL